MKLGKYLCLFTTLIAITLILGFAGSVFAQIEAAGDLRSVIEELRANDGAIPEETARMKIYVSKPEMMSVVRQIVGNQADVVLTGPGGANISRSLNATDFLILLNSTVDPDEQALQVIFPDDAILDKEFYGITFKDFGEYAGVESNYWLSLDNMKIISNTIMNHLAGDDPDDGIFAANTRNFGFELDHLQNTGIEYFTQIGRERSRWVAMTPDVHYVIDNLGVVVGVTIQNADGSFSSGPELATFEFGLMDGDYAGLVCAIELKDEEAGQIAQRMSERSDTPVCWVKTVPGENDSFLSMSAYNMAAMISAIDYERPDQIAQHESTAWGNIVWMFVISAMLIYVIYLNKRVYQLSNMPVPVFEKDRKKKKKK